MVDFCYQKEINYSLCQPCQDTMWGNEARFFSGQDGIKTSPRWSIENQSLSGMYPQGRPVRPRSHLNFQIP